MTFWSHDPEINEKAQQAVDVFEKTYSQDYRAVWRSDSDRGEALFSWTDKASAAQLLFTRMRNNDPANTIRREGVYVILIRRLLLAQLTAADGATATVHDTTVELVMQFRDGDWRHLAGAAVFAPLDVENIAPPEGQQA